MAKLVDILARELREWPEGVDRIIGGGPGMAYMISNDKKIGSIFILETSDDLRNAIVLKDEWRSAKKKFGIFSRNNARVIFDSKIEDSNSTKEKYPQYYKNVADLDYIDVYQVHKVFGIDDHSGAIQHASKKLLLSGVRTGNKSKADDIREARDTLTRWLEIYGDENVG